MSPPLANGPRTSASQPALDLQALSVLAHHRLLRAYLRQRLLVEAAANEPLGEDERQQALMRFVQEHHLAHGDELDRFSRVNVLTPEALNLQVELPLRLQRHCQRHYRAKAEARFLERKQHLDRVVYSLLRLQDGGLARELYLQLQEGEATFADLAARYAEGPEQATRGIVGPVPLTQAHPQLVARLRSAPVGVTQEPFQIDQWWLLVRLESLTPASFDEAMAQQMGQELFEQWLEQTLEAQLEQLRPRLLAPIPPAQPQ